MSVYIIAEAGVNHNGSIELAYKLIDVAVDAGADAIKFQTFTAKNLALRDAKKATYQKQSDNSNESQFDMLKKLELDVDDHNNLIDYTNKKGITFLSSPFDIDSANLLNELDLQIFKIPSGEITNLPYLRHIGALGKQVILSSGMSTLNEIEDALKILINAGTLKNNITILHANTMYPTPMSDVNLKAMQTIKDKFDIKIGYSDHTLGTEVSIAAVAMGASIIEKHFTLSKELYGSDAKHSMEQKEFKFYVNTIKDIWIINKSFVDKDKLTIFKKMKKIFEKSIVTSNIVKKNTILKLRHLNFKKPGDGIRADMYKKIIGKKIKLNLPKDTKLKHSHFY